MERDQACKVSVIMPVYNASAYLDESVGSLLGQNLSDIEIILVDDGSTDASPAMCDAFAASDARVHVIHKANSGAGLSRDIAMKQARGKYLAFLDADDRLHPSALATMYSQAEAENLDVLRASKVDFTTDHVPVGESYGNPLEVHTDPATLRRIALCFIGASAGRSDMKFRFDGGLWGALYRREVVERAGIGIVSERENGSEDFIFNYQVAMVARRYGRTRDTWVHYRLSPQSISRSLSEDKVKKLCGYAMKLEDRLLADRFSCAEARIASMCYLLEQVRGVMKYVLLSDLPVGERLSWCRRQCELPYVRSVIREFPREILPKAHRLHLLLMQHKAMRLLLLLTKIQNTYFPHLHTAIST